MKKKKLTDKQKLKIAVHALKIYGNIDFWNFSEARNEFYNNRGAAPVYTSLEVHDREGKVRNGWEWAEEAIEKIEGKEELSDVPAEGEKCMG